MMMVNEIHGIYFIYFDKKIIILKNEEEFNKQIKGYDRLITINNSKHINKFDNVVDIRIFNWSINNLTNINNLTFIDNIDKKNVKHLFLKQLSHIKENKGFIEQAKEYTKYFKVLNALFEFKYNKNYYLKMKEEYSIRQHFNNKIKKYDNDTIKLDDIKKGVTYSFMNVVSKIYPSNNILQSVDRKKNVELFKIDKNKKYYLVDFVGFETSMLYFYTGNVEYCNNNFYDKYANKFGVDRKEFKLKFLGWLNGMGKIKLGEYYNIFSNTFVDIVELKVRMTNNVFTNFYKHTLLYKKDYLKLGALIQSTAYDFLLRFYHMLYFKYREDDNVRFVWNLFDEFFIECDNSFDVNEIFNNIKLINYSVREF